MAAASQRIDIAKMVDDFLEKQGGAEPEDMYESVTRRQPLEAPHATPMEPVPGTAPQPPLPRQDSWYVVIDEIVETTVTFEAWPWPSIDAATRFLSFDLTKTKRRTFDRDALQRIVDAGRRQQDMSPSADRPLRIGDVFEVTAKKIRDPRTWTSVVDDTRRQRKAAQAALHAMAAPPHFARIDELETIGSELQETATKSTAGSGKTFPAV